MAEYTVFKFFSHLSWKTAEFAVKFSTVLNEFFAINDFWGTCACPEKHGLPWHFSLHWNILSFTIFEHLALALKAGFALSSLYCIYLFYQSGVLSNVRLPWKQRLLWIHCIEYIFFINQDFWATCACPENRVCPEIFQDRGGGRLPRPLPRTPVTLTVSRQWPLLQ